MCTILSLSLQLLPGHTSSRTALLLQSLLLSTGEAPLTGNNKPRLPVNQLSVLKSIVISPKLRAHAHLALGIVCNSVILIVSGPMKKRSSEHSQERSSERSQERSSERSQERSSERSYDCSYLMHVLLAVHHMINSKTQNLIQSQ